MSMITMYRVKWKEVGSGGREDDRGLFHSTTSASPARAYKI